jgi:hypothetical protein
MRGPDDVVVSALPCPHVYSNVLMTGTIVLTTLGRKSKSITSQEEHRRHPILERRRPCFGIKAGYGGKYGGVFAKVRPGVAHFSKDSATVARGLRRRTIFQRILAWLRNGIFRIMSIYGLTQATQLPTTEEKRT